MSEGTEKVICFGEVLWDMLPQGKKIGGAPLNVAYHLKKLGIHSVLVSRVGNDEYGQEIRSFLNAKGLNHSVLQTDFDHPTGKVGVFLHPDQEVSYDIYNNAAWDYIELDDALNKIILQAKYIVFGSLITRHHTSRDTILHLLNTVPVKIFDVNLRKPFYSKQVIQELLERSDMVKMNEGELDILAGWFDVPGSQRSKAEILYDRFHLKTIIITAGAKGGFVFSGGNYIYREAHKVNITDTVGSGDAFLAGFLSECIKGSSLERSLETANKMGALIAQKPGGSPDYSVEAL